MNAFQRIIDALMDEEIDPQIKARMQKHISTHANEKKLEEAFLKYADILKPYKGTLKGDALRSYNKLMAKLMLQNGLAPQPLRRAHRFSVYGRIAAVIIPAVIAIGAIWFIGTWNGEKTMEIASADHVQSVFLPDSSHVLVAAGSHLLYRETSDARSVELSGETFFKIKRDTLKPLHVSTSNIHLDVLGTDFKVSESAAVVSLFDGSVAVEMGGESKTLSSGERLTYDPETGKNKLSIIPATEMIAEGYKPRLIFDRSTLGEVLDAMEVYHDIDIVTAPNVDREEGKLTVNLESMTYLEALEFLIKIFREDLSFESVDGVVNITKK